MDVVLRYFNNKSCLVEASYFDSAFLKRPNSHNLHHKLLEFLSTLYLAKLLQVLMDGPNVNWDVLKLHLSYREQWVLQVDQHWQLRPSCITRCPANRTNGNRLGNEQSFTCNGENIRWITCKERYLYQGNWLWPDDFCKTIWVEMNPLLHEEFRYERILSRLWSTVFNCRN